MRSREGEHCRGILDGQARTLEGALRRSGLGRMPLGEFDHGTEFGTEGPTGRKVIDVYG